MMKETKGLLLKLEELEKDFNVEQDRSSMIRINIHNLTLPGIIVDVCIYADVNRDKYVRINKIFVDSKRGSIGEVRFGRIADYLKEQLLQDKYLLESYKVDSGYIFGEHNFTRHYGGRRSVFLQKVSSKNMELLLKDVQPKNYGLNGYENRTIYYFKNHLYVQTGRKVKVKFEDNFIREFELERNRLGYHLDYAIDEKGIIYTILPVNDPNNIRLFGLNPDKKINNVKTNEVLHNDDCGYEAGHTLKEIISLKEYYNIDVPLEWRSVVLPLVIGNTTIYSERIIGKNIPLFEKDSWIQVNDCEGNSRYKLGKYGKVVEQQNTNLIVVWEDNYENEQFCIDYRYVDKVDNPFNRLEKPTFIAFTKKIKYDNEVINGYGWVTERTKNTAKVVLVKEADLYIKNALGYSSSTSEKRRFAEFKSNFQKVSNEELNYLLVPKNEIANRTISQEFISYMTKEKVDEIKYSAIEGLLQMSGKIANYNLRYFTDLAYFLEKTYKFDNLVNDFCRQVKMSGYEVPYSDQIDFYEPQIEEWILKTIDSKK